PAVGSRIPSRTRISVVLPQPLGPTSPTIEARGTVRSIPSRTTCGPYERTSPRHLTTGGDGSMGRDGSPGGAPPNPSYPGRDGHAAAEHRRPGRPRRLAPSRDP